VLKNSLLVWFDGPQTSTELIAAFSAPLLLLSVRDLKRNAAIRHYIKHLGITVKKLN
jgi:hypothetical protein